MTELPPEKNKPLVYGIYKDSSSWVWSIAFTQVVSRRFFRRSILSPPPNKDQIQLNLGSLELAWALSVYTCG